MSAVIAIPEPYDLCYCGRGKKYKFCHYRLDVASGIERLRIAHAMYLEGWKENANQFRTQNSYSWMASQIQPYHPKRVLDIGCGEGSGIIALMQFCRPELVLSVEDNRICLEQAFMHCASNGLDVEAIKRFDVCSERKAHRISAEKGKLRCPKQVNLIEGDILWDSELLEFLSSLPKFDAITVWLLGTYDIKIECQNIHDLRAFKEIGVYRNTTHQHVYKIADKILNPGGIVHFVDRGLASDVKELEIRSVEEHAWLSQGTNVAIREFQSINYAEANATTRITMENRRSGSVVDSGEPLALVSILAIKR